MNVLIRENLGGNYETISPNDDFPMFYVGTSPEARRDSLEGAGWRIVENGEDGFVWKLQRNVVAGSDFKEHVIEWRMLPAVKEAEETRSPEEWSEVANDGSNAGDEEWFGDGSGRGENFVANLQRDDHIAVWARAQYLGWQNNVRSVAVDVYYSI